MRIESIITLPSTASLPTPASDYARCIVVHNGQLYYCDGTQWYQLSPPSSGGMDDIVVHYRYIWM